MKRIFKKPLVFWFAGIFVLYLALAFLLSGFSTTAQLIVRYAATVNWLKLGVAFFLTLTIGVLVAINAVFWYLRYKERKQCAEGGALATVGTLGGLVTGVCPLCVTGLVPLVLGALGVSFSFASLPLGGIEVQALVVIILFASLWMLKK